MIKEGSRNIDDEANIMWIMSSCIKKATKEMCGESKGNRIPAKNLDVKWRNPKGK